MIAAATVVRTSAARGRTRPVSPATAVGLAGVIARRWSRLIRAASAVAAAAVVRRARAIARRRPRVIRATSAVAATAVVRRAGAVTRRGPRVIGAASAVAATGTAIGRCRSLTHNGRAYWQCARLRTGVSEVAPAAAGLAAVVGCRSELISRRRPIWIHILPRCGHVGPIDLCGSIVRLTESTPTTVVARASAKRRGCRGLHAGWLAGTAPAAAGLATAAIGCRT